MKKLGFLTTIAIFIITLAVMCCDVYWDGIGWYEMGCTDDQTWYEYYVSLYQSGLHDPSSKEYKVGQYCYAHPELANADPTQVEEACINAGIISGERKKAVTTDESISEENKKESNDKSTQTTQSERDSITESNYDETKQYVVISKKAVYDNYDSKKNEVGSIAKGIEVSVKGETSNGYYIFDYTTEDGSTIDGYLLFKGKDNIVSKEEYDAAWSETARKEATCTESGYIEYTNSLSGLTYQDELLATGHVTSSSSKYEVEKPGIFTKGKTIVYCDICGQVAYEEDIDSYFAKEPVLIVAICVFGAIIIAATIYILIKKIMNM